MLIADCFIFIHDSVCFTQPIEMNGTKLLSEIVLIEIETSNENVEYNGTCTISAIQAIKLSHNVSAAQFLTDAICLLNYVYAWWNDRLSSISN